MWSIWYGILLLSVVSICNGLTLKRRVESLESQSHVQNGKLIELTGEMSAVKDMISELNSTLLTGDSKISSPSGLNSESANTAELVEKIGKFMNEQIDQIKRIERGLMEEKTIYRQMIDKIKTGENDNSAQSNKQLEELIAILNNRLESEEKKRNLSNTDILESVDSLADQVRNMTEMFEILQLSMRSVSNTPGRSVKPVRPCPIGWVQWKDRCYLYIANETAIWDVANMHCQDRGGILAEPNTKEAMLHLFGLVGQNSDNVWLGATDEETDGTWLWASTKKEVKYFKWEPGQPNNFGGKQDCLEIYNGQLNDDKCDVPNQYLCQRYTYQE